MKFKPMLRVFEIVIVGAAIAVLGVKHAKNDAYEEYVKEGGRRSFFSWLAASDDALDEDIAQGRAKQAAVKAKKEQARRESFAARQAEAKAEAERIATLEKKAAELRAKLRRTDEASQRVAEEYAKRHAEAAKHRGGAVKTGGKSGYVRADGRTPYRVSGIQGIEFGSSDNAPGPNVKPILSVRYDENGNMVFQGLKWSEGKNLTDPVYGFEKATLEHSIDSEQLSSVTFNRSFPFTEQGYRDAMAFYEKMSGEASADLGFEAVTQDRTDKLRTSSICGFTNKGGDTTISGGVSAWSDSHFTVSLRVADNAYSAEMRSQSNAAYESGLADTIDARVVVGKDCTENKIKVNEFLGK